MNLAVFTNRIEEVNRQRWCLIKDMLLILNTHLPLLL